MNTTRYFLPFPLMQLPIRQGLPHQLRTLHLLSNGIYIAQCSIYTLLRCSIMTALSLRKIPFYISGQYRAEVADTAVCTPDFAVLPSALVFQARPIDSLNRTSYKIVNKK